MEQLDFNIKVYIHYSTAQTGAASAVLGVYLGIFSYTIMSFGATAAMFDIYIHIEKYILHYHLGPGCRNMHNGITLYVHNPTGDFQRTVRVTAGPASASSSLIPSPLFS